MIAGKWILLWLFLCPSFSGNSIVQKQYCHIYGTFYIVDDPKDADYRVYEEESEGSADVWVYETDDKLFADRPGLWYFTETKAFADYYVYFDKQKHLADFSICFIDTESFAGCND